MPWLNKRWISFFIISAVVGVVLISLAGWGSNHEGNKVRNEGGQFFFSFSFIVTITDILFAKSGSAQEWFPTGILN
jgi:hypothetical protein